MSNIITKGTLGVYKGQFRNIRGLQGQVTEDTEVSEGFIWMDFGNKRIHRVDLTRVDWTDIGVVAIEPLVVKKEEIVEIDTE